MTRNRSVLLALGLAAVLTSALAPNVASAAEVIDCAGAHEDPRQDGWPETPVTSSIEDADGRFLGPGRYALPATSEPTKLVVMFHGHGNDSCSWRKHLLAAASSGAVAVAMDYSAPVLLDDGSTYGWMIRLAARDSIQAARHFMRVYPSITTVIAFGISMGGNTSGFTVASPFAVREDGSPLFDYWISVEGVNNLIEEYLIARAVAPVNATAALAVKEIEEENGGKLEEVPERYVETTNVLRAEDMTHLKGAVVVHGFDDGLVPTTQTPEMMAALTLNGITAHQINVVLRGDAEAGTTGTAIVAGPLFERAGLGPYESPLAGHGWEGSDTHLVIKAGFEALHDLLADVAIEPGLTIIPGAW